MLLQRLGGEHLGQLAGGYGAAERGRLPGPHRREIARALRLGLGAQRRERIRSERKFGRHVGHRSDLAHHSVDDAARGASGHEIGQRGAVVARRVERGLHPPGCELAKLKF
jgi:hypothetical protein